MKLVAILHTLLIGTTFIPKTGLPHSSQTVLTLLSDFAASYPALSGFETQIHKFSNVFFAVFQRKISCHSYMSVSCKYVKIEIHS